MEISKAMVHHSLQSRYWPSKLLGAVMSKKWGLRLGYRFARNSAGAKASGLHCEELFISSRQGGPEIRVRIFRPLNNHDTLPAMLYLHGGGYAMGCPLRSRFYSIPWSTTCSRPKESKTITHPYGMPTRRPWRGTSIFETTSTKMLMCHHMPLLLVPPASRTCRQLLVLSVRSTP